MVTNMPWRVADYWRMTHRIELADFHTAGAVVEARRSQPIAP
ncbi:hypothetical protein [Nocardia sp. NPDC047654]